MPDTGLPADFFASATPVDVTTLNVALQPYVEDLHGIGQCLRSPFVYQVPLFNVALANRMYEEKLAAFRACCRHRDHLQALHLVERGYRPTMLTEWVGDGTVEPNALAPLLTFVWKDTEQAHGWATEASALFATAGYCSDTPARLQGPLAIYRGSGSGQLGLSWTLDREQALWFARRWGASPDALLFAGTVNAQDIWGYFTGRGEAEIVVDPTRVRDVTTQAILPLVRETPSPS